jgi:hypothetical protein
MGILSSPRSLDVEIRPMNEFRRRISFDRSTQLADILVETDRITAPASMQLRSCAAQSDLN